MIRTSEKTDAIDAMLFTLQREAPMIDKNKSIDAGKYKFKTAGLAHIWSIVHPLMIARDLFITWGGTRECVVCRVTHAISGQWRESYVPLYDPASSDLKNTVGSVTVFRRQALVCALGLIVVDEDDEARLIHEEMRTRELGRRETIVRHLMKLGMDESPAHELVTAELKGRPETGLDVATWRDIYRKCVAQVAKPDPALEP